MKQDKIIRGKVDRNRTVETGGGGQKPNPIPTAHGAAGASRIWFPKFFYGKFCRFSFGSQAREADAKRRQRNEV